MNIKKEDKMLLFIKNLISDKLNTSYIDIFRVKEVKEVTILLKLLDIKIHSRFHVLLLKKVFSNTL